MLMLKISEKLVENKEISPPAFLSIYGKEDVAKIEKDLNMYTGLTQITKSGKSMKISNYLILLLQ